MFDGILFDLDGTLWDATPTMVEVWDQLLAGRPNIVRPPVSQAEIRANMGRLLDDIALRMFPQQGEEEIEDEGHYDHGDDAGEHRGQSVGSAQTGEP